MSIRPVVLEDAVDTSFEDVESTFTCKDDVAMPPLAPNSALSSTTDSTTFSKDKRYSSHTELASDLEDDINYASDFEEYQDGRDLQLAVDQRFRESASQHELEELQEQLEKKLSLNVRNRHSNNNAYSNAGMVRPSLKAKVRQPKSMIDLAGRNQGPERTNMFGGMQPRRLPNSRSYMNMESSSRPRLNYKASMPSLMRFNHHHALLEDEDDNYAEEEEDDDEPRPYVPRIRHVYRDSNYNHFGAREYTQPFPAENNGRDEDFGNDFEGIDNNFQITPDIVDDALDQDLQMLPIDYDVEHDDSLLTPQLHRKHHEFAVPLDSYREKRRGSAAANAYDKVTIKGKSSSRARSRLKTIRQEINFNTPMKRGKMSYNPTEKKWDGNEDILRSFENIENVDRKAFIIKNKRSRSPLKKSHSTQPLSSGINPVSLNSEHGKIVGKMRFDEKNLRWIRVDGPEDDPFQGITDLQPVSQSSPTRNVKFQPSQGFTSTTLRSQSQLLPLRDENGNRFTSSNSTRFHSLTTKRTSDPTYQISSKQLEKFYREENKWSRKVGGWFILGDEGRYNDGGTGDQSHTSLNDKSYMYEIRNMVISSARN